MPYTPFLIVGNKMDLRRKKQGTIKKVLEVEAGEGWGVAHKLYAFFWRNFFALRIFLMDISCRIVLLS